MHVIADTDKCTEFLLDTCAGVSDADNNPVGDVPGRQLTAATGRPVAP